MTEGINGINGIDPNKLAPEKTKQEDKILDFSKLLKDAIEEVNSIQKNADKVAADYAAGNITDIHQVMIAAEKAS
ncbi:MAG: flagellar hook-basal body complex protein FliE, partial [Petrotoga sp.]|nr:flagellar hook-basal body complex protein FliE [Petrotoga sp.]